MILHDYCCCGGLGADGYASVFGASVIRGYDIEQQPEYPYAFRSLPWDKLKEGFPPAYTAWVAADLLVELRRRAVCDYDDGVIDGWDQGRRLGPVGGAA